MNRITLETIIAERKKMPRSVVSDVLQEFQEVVLESMRKNEEVRIVGFGVFFARKQKARRGKNPKTQEPLNIPASLKPSFRPGANLTDALNLPAKPKKAPAATKRRR